MILITERKGPRGSRPFTESVYPFFTTEDDAMICITLKSNKPGYLMLIGFLRVLPKAIN